MEQLQEFGSANACALLKAFGFYQMYRDICVNGRIGDAYVHAGWIFLGSCAFIVVLLLYILRKAVAFTSS